jgi:hypothetical protein
MTKRDNYVLEGGASNQVSVIKLVKPQFETSEAMRILNIRYVISIELAFPLTLRTTMMTVRRIQK